MTDRSDQTRLTANELRSLVTQATGVPPQIQATFRILWRAHPTDPSAACLTVGMPRLRSDCPHDAFRGRLIWWPDGLTELRRVAIMSSRLGARLDQHQWWFDLLRTAVLRINVCDECVVAVEDTAPHGATMRAAEVFGIPRLNISVDDHDVGPEQLVTWLTNRMEDRQSSWTDVRTSQWQALVSPCLHYTNKAAQTDHARVAPLQDRCAVAASERSYVLSCRSGGHVHQLLHDSLKSGSDSPLILYLGNGSGTSDETARELISAGAIPWLVAGISTASVFAARRTATTPSAVVIADGPLVQPEGWLCHWTRPRTGPWPGQPVTEFLDELLLGCESADRSALAALLQIIARGAVYASVVRGEHRAVSFTEVPLSEFRRRRVYRRHRKRYDFEPWGVAVRRSSLERLGARPVQYGDRTEPSSTQNSVWFQPTTDQLGHIDWRQEQEWRLAQDLQLQELPTSAVFLFVDSSHEADVVGAQTDWPMVVVPD